MTEIKLRPLQNKWLTQIGGAENGRLAFHVNRKADLNALQDLLESKLIRIVTAFENDLYLTEITDLGRGALSERKSAASPVDRTQGEW